MENTMPEETVENEADSENTESSRKRRWAPTRETPVTMVIFYVNIIITVGLLLLAVFNPDIDYRAAFMLGAKENVAIANGEYWRFFTAFFVNTPLILLINLYSLNAISSAVEKIHEAPLFLATYLLGGLVSVVASYFLSTEVSLGAGGAIAATFGLFFGFIFRYKNIANALLPGIREEAFRLIGLNILFSLLPFIDGWSLLAGFLTGWGIFEARRLIRSNFSRG